MDWALTLVLAEGGEFTAYEPALSHLQLKCLLLWDDCLIHEDPQTVTVYDGTLQVFTNNSQGDHTHVSHGGGELDHFHEVG